MSYPGTNDVEASQEMAGEVVGSQVRAENRDIRHKNRKKDGKCRLQKIRHQIIELITDHQTSKTDIRVGVQN